MSKKSKIIIKRTFAKKNDPKALEEMVDTLIRIAYGLYAKENN